jgi:hypothetical protein
MGVMAPPIPMRLKFTNEKNVQLARPHKKSVD